MSAEVGAICPPSQLRPTSITPTSGGIPQAKDGSTSGGGCGPFHGRMVKITQLPSYPITKFKWRQPPTKLSIKVTATQEKTAGRTYHLAARFVHLDPAVGAIAGRVGSCCRLGRRWLL